MFIPSLSHARRITPLISLLGFLVLSTAWPAAVQFIPPQEGLMGWAVCDLAKDSLLEGKLEHSNFTPASTQKLFTTWIALDLLGSEQQFTTQLAYSGSLKNQTLLGDLIIQGGGDPSLGDSKMLGEGVTEKIFSTWMMAIKKFGIHKIEGCILGDGRYLQEGGPHPAMIWEDAGNYYAGTVSGLSFNGNIYTLTFTGAGSPGKSVALVKSQPKHTGIARFDNQILTGTKSSMDSAFILGGFPSSVRELRGTYPAGKMPFFIKGSLPNPAWTCAREFQDYLVAQGFIRLSNSKPQAKKKTCGDPLSLPNHKSYPKVKNLPESQILSPTVKDLIRHTNQKSDNGYAGQLLALIGKQRQQSPDWQGGLKVVNAYLDQRGFPLDEIHLKDGTGLSRYNWISPMQTAKLLTYISRQKGFADFKASLVDSQLERYGPSWDGKGWEGRLWVKTGTLEGVRALAGYVRAKSGRMLAFSITANNFAGNGSEFPKDFGTLLQAWATKY